jgi:hypothetical protein
MFEDVVMYKCKIPNCSSNKPSIPSRAFCLCLYSRVHQTRSRSIVRINSSQYMSFTPCCCAVWCTLQYIYYRPSLYLDSRLNILDQFYYILLYSVHQLHTWEAVHRIAWWKSWLTVWDPAHNKMYVHSVTLWWRLYSITVPAKLRA